MSMPAPDEERPVDPDSGLPQEPILPDEDRSVPIEDEGDIVADPDGSKDDAGGAQDRVPD